MWKYKGLRIVQRVTNGSLLKEIEEIRPDTEQVATCPTIELHLLSIEELLKNSMQRSGINKF